jgi:hypothetical protein
MMERLALRRAWLPALAAGGLAALALAGCGGSAQQRSEGSHQRSRSGGLGIDRRLVATRIVRGCAEAGVTPSASRAYGAFVRRTASVRTWPGARAHLVRRFGAEDQNGFPTVFGVLGSHGDGCGPLWLRVQLPTRPNGSTGWVRASEVSVYPVGTRIVVDLSSRRVLLYRWGELAFSTRVAVGARETPTPVGSYYVDERFLLDTPDGPFGAAALGISAHSDALRNWVQGGPVALHGTNEPAAIGGGVSHGCVRLVNRDMLRVFKFAPAGTPVLIRR